MSMNLALSSIPARVFTLAALALASGLAITGPLNAADKAVSTYSRFEHSLESAATYGNPVQEATLTVTFTSPSGDKFVIPGFWDGGKTWKVRFLPTKPGTWKFETTCSDASNRGLHQQA